MKLEFSGQFFQKYLNTNFMKIRQLEPVGWRQTDRQNDMTDLILTFRNFANVSRNE